MSNQPKCECGRCVGIFMMDEVYICHDCSIKRIKELESFVDLFRLKRAYDGLNGRVWNARKHLDAEEKIAEILSDKKWD